jgi:hypothetical protein
MDLTIPRTTITFVKWVSSGLGMTKIGIITILSGWYYGVEDSPPGAIVAEGALRKLPPDEDNQEWEKFKSKLDMDRPVPVATTEEDL